MKNIPRKIFLNIGDISREELEGLDFNDLLGVSWCADKINDNDIEFELLIEDLNGL